MNQSQIVLILFFYNVKTLINVENKYKRSFTNNIYFTHNSFNYTKSSILIALLLNNQFQHSFKYFFFEVYIFINERSNRLSFFYIKFSTFFVFFFLNGYFLRSLCNWSLFTFELMKMEITYLKPLRII